MFVNSQSGFIKRENYKFSFGGIFLTLIENKP